MIALPAMAPAKTLILRHATSGSCVHSSAKPMDAHQCDALTLWREKFGTLSPCWCLPFDSISQPAGPVVDVVVLDGAIVLWRWHRAEPLAPRFVAQRFSRSQRFRKPLIQMIFLNQSARDCTKMTIIVINGLAMSRANFAARRACDRRPSHRRCPFHARRSTSGPGHTRTGALQQWQFAFVRHDYATVTASAKLTPVRTAESYRAMCCKPVHRRPLITRTGKT